MGSASAIVWCLAYIVGLLVTAIPFGGVILLACGSVAAISFAKFRRTALSYIKPEYTIARLWLIAGLIGLLAGLYLQVRSPQPSINDISRFIPNEKQQVTVYGRLEELPRLTRSGKSQIWLQVAGLDTTEKKVDGKLYVTLPTMQAKDLFPGQAIALTGSLYQPKPAMNPGGFNFQKYLKQEDCFAGFTAESIQPIDPNQKPKWGWWMIQQKIVRSHVEQLGISEGALVSAMVLGSRVVDIPFDIKDAFARIGLAHALAASGFQVSLILSVILILTRRLPKLIQFGFGTVGLFVFLALTGMQPAVLRAVLMGFAVLLGLTINRKVKPLGSLLLAATILLFANPIWIWSLSFQFSFLATLGLLVTVPALTKRLDWIPTIFVPAIAVPVAAFIWTLPLQLYMFGITSPYSIPANIVTTVLISIISIGGIISAALNLVSPVIGNFVSQLLYYPSHGLIEIVNFFCRLPGNSVAIGTISIVLMLVLYMLICLPWLQPKYQHQWWISLILGASLVFIPAWYIRANLLQVTALSAGQDPILVIQDHGRVGLINSGDEDAVRFTVLPFLSKEGVNQIDWAIAAHPATSDGWSIILERLPIQTLYGVVGTEKPAIAPQAIQALATRHGEYLPLAAEQNMSAGNVTVRPVSVAPTIVQVQIGQRSWLWMKDLPNVKQRQKLKRELAGNQVLWWSGQKIHPKLLEMLQPGTAIAYSSKINSVTFSQLLLNKVQTYQTNQEGAIQWTPTHGFRATSELNATDASLL